MRKLFLMAWVVLMSQLNALAQSPDVRALLAEDPDRAACNMHPYEFLPIVDTPAPEGYRPFYIAHYGRHGSRYDMAARFGAPTYSQMAYDYLSKADSLGQLTEQGRTLKEMVRQLSYEHIGMEGELTPRGGREHQQLAERMASRFPEVFSQADRRQVFAVSSTTQRCIVSMGNFISSLKGCYPALQMNLTSGHRYNYLTQLAKPVKGIPTEPRYKIRHTASQEKAPSSADGAGEKPDFSHFMALVFTQPEAHAARTNDIVQWVFKAGCVCRDLDYLDVDVFHFFTPDELYSKWRQDNRWYYGNWAHSIERGDENALKAVPLLSDIIEKADRAMLPGSTTVADLRFGHDIPYMALLSLMGLDTDDGQRYTEAEAYRHWASFQVMPTAANLQLVFYRNPTGRVLVKILRNEREVPLPRIKPVSPPYYDWQEVKQAYISEE